MPSEKIRAAFFKFTSLNSQIKIDYFHNRFHEILLIFHETLQTTLFTLTGTSSFIFTLG